MAAFLSRHSVDFIKERAQNDKPWLMYIDMFEPHPPYNGPLNDMYDPSSLPMGSLFLDQPEENTPLFNRARAKFHTAEAEEINPEDPEAY